MSDEFVRQLARLFDVPLELIDPVFATELAEVREIHAHLPFAHFMDMAEDDRG